MRGQQTYPLGNIYTYIDIDIDIYVPGDVQQMRLLQRRSRLCAQLGRPEPAHGGSQLRDAHFYGSNTNKYKYKYIHASVEMKSNLHKYIPSIASEVG